ncbi:LytTR family transcriptional regulator [Aestuariibacter sp. GS-14]|nr:LytTR family transcriptional regulator [Aestuariibacter sp. GS-14]
MTQGKLAQAFSLSLQELTLPECQFEFTTDLHTQFCFQARLQHPGLSTQESVAEHGSLKILVVGSHDLSLLSLDAPRCELSVLCGYNNQQAIDGFAKGISRFYQPDAPTELRQRQITDLIDAYYARINALKWQWIIKRLSWQRACSPARLLQELSALKTRSTAPHHQISLRSSCGWHCVDWQRIRYVEAAGDYMCVYTQEETLIVRSTLTELAQRLPQSWFLRVNRSVIINLHHVKGLTKLSPAVNYVELKDGSRLKISRRLLPQCLRYLDGKVWPT